MMPDSHPDKVAAKLQWNTNPCGSGAHLAELEYGSVDWFDAVRQNRYHGTDTWMMRLIPFGAVSGKRLLEIGYGLGTDLLTFAEAGADPHGIDLVEEHRRLAERNFALHGRAADLRLGDAAQLPWPDGYFDLVYSNGVLHHTPDTVRCITEAWRVLKPNGLFILSMYHTWSAFHLGSMLLYQGLIRGRLRRLGYRSLMATLEFGADGIDIRPLVKTYSKSQLRHMLGDFTRVEVRCAHFKRDHVPGGRLLPRSVETILEPYLGWYVIAFATK
jgi:ubiquinone/menaquinone biosynthesis C-methylase UbiE